MTGPDDLSLSIPISVGDLPLVDRVDRAVAAGYRVLESWWPWAEDVPAASDRDAFVGAFRRHGARLHLLNLTEGPIATGGRGIAGVAGDDNGFTAHAEAAVGLAADLGARWINALAGNVALADRRIGRELLAARIGELAAAGQPHGVGVVLELLNREDHPDYLLSPDEVAPFVRRLRSQGADVSLLADVYHLAKSGKDPARFITEHAGLIGHVQVADHPGRGRPGSGAIDFARVLASLDAAGYDGMIGLEHLPGLDLPGPKAAWQQLRPEEAPA